MKIAFSTHYKGPGGARSWIKGFSDYCIRNGHTVNFGYDDTADVFCSVANLSTEQELINIKSKNIKILQRLGAIYLDYNHPNPLLIKRKNEEIKALINYADDIVYQSNFCKYTLFSSIYDGNPPEGSIIYNCADSTLFTGNGPKLDRPTDKKVILAVAYWGTPHTATESINILIDVIKHFESRKDIEFWVLGRAFEPHYEKIKSYNFKNVAKLDLLTPVDPSEMPILMRSADMLLHLKAHEGCSNSVIETICTGKPLVGINSGSLPELVSDAALLCNCSNSIKTFPNVDINDLINKVDLTLSNLPYYSKAMLNRMSNFTEEKTYAVYLDKLIKLYNS